MRYEERDEEKRAIFLEQITLLPKSSLIYVDESGINSYLHRSHGWAKRGETVFGEVSGKRFARESFVAAKCKSKILAPLCFQGTCNTKPFNLRVRKFPVPVLRPGQVVIMDNATFHKSKKARSLIEQAGRILLFLPPYSPNLNPIEKFWARFKAKVRSLIHRFKTLAETIDYVFSQ